MNIKYSQLLFYCLMLLIAGCGPAAKSGLPVGNQSVGDAIRVSDDGTDAAEPSIAVDAEGNIYVVYVEHLKDSGSADVYLQNFSQNALPVGEKVRVNHLSGQAKAWFGDPPTIRIASDNTVYIGWTAKVPGAEKGSATDLFISASRDGGKTFAQNVKVNDDAAPASHGMHSLETGDDGRVYAAWLDERNVKPADYTGDGKHEAAEPNSEVYFSKSNDGGLTFSANKKISSEVCPCCKTSMTSSGGHLYLSWRQVLPGDFRHIAVAGSSDGGDNFAPYSIVSDDQWQINACPVSGASLYIDADAALNVVWYSSGKAVKPGLQHSRSSDGGNTFSPRISIFEGVVRGTTVLYSAGGFTHAVFESNGKLLQAPINSGGETAALEISAGELPSSVSIGDDSFVCFIKNEGGKRSVSLRKISGRQTD